MNEKEMGASELYLAPQTEVFDQAAEIAQTTVADTKYPFTLEYDLNEKEYLLSVLNAAGAVVTEENDSANSMTVSMNMSQLRLIKSLDCITRVKTNESRSTRSAAFDAFQINNEAVATASAEARVMMIANDEFMVANEVNVASAEDGIAVACVSGCTAGNNTKETALEISVESTVNGCICCPGAEQWFKFTAPESKQYTVFTKGSLDTVGTLYGGDDAKIGGNDDFAGNLNFRIGEALSTNCEYYIQVSAKYNATGNYTLKVTGEILAEEVVIQSDRSDGLIVLEQGKTYELPRGEGYGYLYNDGEFYKERTPIYHVPLFVEVNPNDTEDKRVFWYASPIPSNPVTTNSYWYDNTTKYQTIKANGIGGTKLYAYDWFEQGKIDVAYVAVVPAGGSLVKSTGISLDHSSLSMELGEYQTITATVSPSYATVKDVEWVSDNTNIATVTPFGRVKAIAHGTTTIRAKAMDGSGVYGCCVVNISSHIYNAALSEDRNEYTFTCESSQCDDSFTVPKDQVIGSYVTSETNPNLGNSQTPLAYGIDLSSYTEEILQSQWNEIASTQIDGHPIAFVILRIGREVSNNPDGSFNRKKDEQFENNYVRAKAAGLHVGCYYCTESWSPQNAIADAEQVIEWIGDKQFEYPVFFDIESKDIANNENVPNNTARTEICTAFMNKMREAGFFTGLYTNAKWITDYLNSSTLFPKYDVWYTRYREDHSTPDFWGWNQETTKFKWPESGRKFGMWQYAKNIKISPRVTAIADLNVVYKNYPLIIKALHLNNFK